MPVRPPLFVTGSDPVLGRLRRLVVPVLVGTLLGLLAGIAVHSATPATWTAQVAMELSSVRDRMDLNPTGTRGDLVSFDTDAQLAYSDAVVLAVAVDQQRPVTTVRSSIEVSARPLSRILLLSYTARSPDAAQDGAVLAARTLLQERDRLYLAPQREYLDDLFRTTDSIDPQFDLVTASGDAPARESLRRSAYVEQLRLQEPGRVVGENGLTSVADRGDIEVPLTSGAATGALLAVLLVAAAPQRVSVGASRSAPVVAARPRARLRGPRRTRRRVAGTAVVVLLVLVGGALSLPVALALPRAYQGEARVYLQPEGGTAFAAQSNPNVERVDFGTEAELVRSDEVLSRVAAAPGVGLDVAQLRSRTRGTPAARGEVVEITFRSGSWEQAETVTALLAAEFVAVRQDRAADWYQQQSATVDSAMTAAEGDLAAALGPAGSRDLVNALNRRVTLLRADSQALLSSRVEGGEVLAVEVQGDVVDRYLAAVVALSGPALGLALGALAWLVVRHRAARPRAAGSRYEATAAPGPSGAWPG